MKYGILEVGNANNRSDSGFFNIGDNIQGIALEHILREEMQIDKNDIVKIDFHELSCYDGEYLIVPINLFFFGCRDARKTWFPASHKIIPVFVGVHFTTNCLDEESVAYLRNYAPIGCRDEYTLRTMQKYHIPAYLAGCVTATLPRRNTVQKAGRPFLVDVPTELEKHIPPDILNRAIKIEHEFYGPYCEDSFEKADKMAIETLKRYREEASLVITSRLHCASPCMAIGIPTIFAPKQFSSRFSWIDSLLPIYPETEYNSIEWYPSPVEYENLKHQMVEVIVTRIKECATRWQPLCTISDFFIGKKSRVCVDPLNPMIYQLKKYFDKNPLGQYVIWGLTCVAQQVYATIQQDYPEARLEAVIDEYNQGVFNSLESQTSEKLSQYTHLPILATPTGAKPYILKKLAEINYQSTCIFADGDIYEKK